MKFLKKIKRKWIPMMEEILKPWGVESLHLKGNSGQATRPIWGTAVFLVTIASQEPHNSIRDRRLEIRNLLFSFKISTKTISTIVSRISLGWLSSHKLNLYIHYLPICNRSTLRWCRAVTSMNLLVGPMNGARASSLIFSLRECKRNSPSRSLRTRPSTKQNLLRLTLSPNNG